MTKIRLQNRRVPIDRPTTCRQSTEPRPSGSGALFASWDASASPPTLHRYCTTTGNYPLRSRTQRRLWWAAEHCGPGFQSTREFI